MLKSNLAGGFSLGTGSIARAVRDIKDDLFATVSPDLILDICIAEGHRWRNRVLGPVETLHLFIVQVLHGNTSCAHVRVLGRFGFSRATYCAARGRIPLGVYRALLRSTGQELTEHRHRQSLWRGHRLIGIDGSSFSMPWTEELWNRYHWRVCDMGIEFPVARIVAIFDLVTGALLDMIPATMRDHEVVTTQPMLDELCRDDVVVADRLYCSANFIGQLAIRGIHAVIRVPVKSRQVNFKPHRPHAKHHHWRGIQSRWIRRNGRQDQVVEWRKPLRRPQHISGAEWSRIPEWIEVRELRYRVVRRGFRSREVTLVTTLLDADAYPKGAIATLYGDRWQVETNIRHLKTTMKMDVMRSKSVEGVQRELAIFGVVYNLVRRVMLESAIAEGVHADRVSFIDALRWVMLGCPGEILVPLAINPRRQRTPAPRMKRRRRKAYMKMRYARAPQRETPGEPRLIL